jgi:hypothetical protein
MIYGRTSLVGITRLSQCNWKGNIPARTWQGQRQLRRIYTSFLRNLLEALHRRRELESWVLNIDERPSDARRSRSDKLYKEAVR